MLRSVLRGLFRLLYRVEVTGFEHFEKAGERVLVVANHLSFLDALLVALFLPEKPMFAVNTHISKRWWMQPFLSLVHSFPLDPTNPISTKSIIQEIRKGRKCVIFPEGRITVTGSLMKVYEGPGMIADKSDATILPVRIDGAQYTPFSRLKGKVRIRWFPKITLHMLPPCAFGIDENIKGRARRAKAGQALYDTMSEMLFDTAPYRSTLWQGLRDAQVIYGAKHRIIEDVQRQPLSYRQLVARSLILGRALARKTKVGERVGLLLPNMATTVVSFFAMQAIGRVPAMLNFSVGSKNLLSTCQTAELKSVYTSQRFIEAGKLEAAIEAMEAAGVTIHYLEEVAKTISPFDKLIGLLGARCRWFAAGVSRTPDDPCVVLFTSGSEGSPKGVVLSHANIQANRFQLSARVDFGATDIVFNALPMFHSFGLTGGTLLPVLAGVKTFFYPSPLHYRIVPELVYDTNATIMFGTDTFLSGYARFANAYDFYSVRYAFAGAEKLKEETRRLWSEKYGVRIFEGYGATETAPVIATNTPMHNKVGTVGRIMPGIDTRLEPVAGIEDGGRLFVHGPNVMLGYLMTDTPGVLQPPEAGWYDTGDIVHIDDDGYVTIKGRAKRFAKIGGEMVSLTAVESALASLWPDAAHAVVNLPDAKKGEKLVLLTEQKDASREALTIHFKALGMGELSIPRVIRTVDAIPVLGTGKVDYVAAKEIAEEKD